MVQQAYMTRDALRAALENLPRVRIAFLPTPLQECPRLSQALGGPPILVKRDDLTGQALGGNKDRHSEFRIGYALAEGYDVYIYVADSNAGRSAAAACAKLGMRCILLVKGHKEIAQQGNLFLEHLLGAELIFLDNEDEESLKTEMKALEERLRHESWKPYVIQNLPWFHHSGIFSYLVATLELEQQLLERGVQKAHFYMVAGHSQAGLQLGAKLLGLPWRVTGIAVGQYFESHTPMASWSQEAAAFLGLPASLTPEEVVTTFDYMGPTYGSLTEAGTEAIRLVATTENIILDPRYTGKAMAALIDHVRKGKTSAEETLVFIHTGGIPHVFQDARELTKDLAKRPGND